MLCLDPPLIPPEVTFKIFALDPIAGGMLFLRTEKWKESQYLPCITKGGAWDPFSGFWFQGQKSFRLSVVAPVGEPHRAADIIVRRGPRRASYPESCPNSYLVSRIKSLNKSKSLYKYMLLYFNRLPSLISSFTHCLLVHSPTRKKPGHKKAVWGCLNEPIISIPEGRLGGAAWQR